MNKVDKNTLVELYSVQKKPMHLIAKELKIAIGTVFNYLKKYDIETRKKEETFNFKGFKQKQEVKQKISNTHKGKILTEDTKNKMSESHKGKFITINKWNAHTKHRKDGYIGVYIPGHPNCNKEGYVMEHRLVMEEFLGRILTSEEVVHHINNKRNDNRIENLMLFNNSSEHIKFHNKLKRSGLSLIR